MLSLFIVSLAVATPTVPANPAKPEPEDVLDGRACKAIMFAKDIQSLAAARVVFLRGLADQARQDYARMTADPRLKMLPENTQASFNAALGKFAKSISGYGKISEVWTRFGKDAARFDRTAQGKALAKDFCRKAEDRAALLYLNQRRFVLVFEERMETVQSRKVATDLENQFLYGIKEDMEDIDAFLGKTDETPTSDDPSSQPNKEKLF